MWRTRFKSLCVSCVLQLSRSRLTPPSSCPSTLLETEASPSQRNGEAFTAPLWKSFHQRHSCVIPINPRNPTTPNNCHPYSPHSHPSPKQINKIFLINFFNQLFFKAEESQNGLRWRVPGGSAAVLSTRGRTTWSRYSRTIDNYCGKLPDWREWHHSLSPCPSPMSHSCFCRRDIFINNKTIEEKKNKTIKNKN